jgi:hypothetical protein
MTTTFNIRVEEQLLVGLCRLQFTDEQLINIRSLISLVTDWEYFKNLSNKHGIAAMVWHNLEKNHIQSGIPEEVALFLRGALMRNLSRNIFNTGLTAEALGLLNREKIKTVILKGLALENSVYGNLGLRQMSDVDILISRKDCLRAREVLMSAGYTSLPVKSFLHRMILPYYGKHLPSLLKNGASLEIHHELFGRRNHNLTKVLYDSSYKTELKGERTWFPEPQIFFLYLVKHLGVHEMNNESQLRLYADMVVLLEKFSDEILNYDLLEYASGAGMSEILATKLDPLREMWGISFPDWVNDFIEKWADKDSISRFIFFLGSPKDNPPCDKPGFYRQIVGDIPGFHRKLMYVLGDLFPSLSFMRDRYKCKSTWKVLFYYPHRLGKLLWLFRK